MIVARLFLSLRLRNACGVGLLLNWRLEFSVSSCQDLTLLSLDELRSIFSPDEADHVRTHLKTKKIEMIPPKK